MSPGHQAAFGRLDHRETPMFLMQGRAEAGVT